MNKLFIQRCNQLNTNSFYEYFKLTKHLIELAGSIRDYELEILASPTDHCPKPEISTTSTCESESLKNKLSVKFWNKMVAHLVAVCLPVYIIYIVQPGSSTYTACN